MCQKAFFFHFLAGETSEIGKVCRLGDLHSFGSTAFGIWERCKPLRPKENELGDQVSLKVLENENIL